MNYKVNYSDEFYEDLLEIKNYIAEDDLQRANSFILKLYKAAAGLTVFPNSNKPLQEKFKCELPKPFKYLINNGYYIIYLVADDTIQVYRAISCKQDIMQFIEFTI